MVDHLSSLRLLIFLCWRTVVGVDEDQCCTNAGLASSDKPSMFSA